MVYDPNFRVHLVPKEQSRRAAVVGQVSLCLGLEQEAHNLEFARSLGTNYEP